MVNIASVGTVVIKVVKLVSDIASTYCQGPNTGDRTERVCYMLFRRARSRVRFGRYPRGCNRASGESRPSVITNPIVLATTLVTVVIKDPRFRHTRHVNGLALVVWRVRGYKRIENPYIYTIPGRFRRVLQCVLFPRGIHQIRDPVSRSKQT